MPNVHCDDLIDDKSQPLALRRYLRYHRWPALWQCRAHNLGVKEPVLYATLRDDLAKDEAAHVLNFKVKPGSRVRIVMASRFGDLGITTELNAERGYSVRVYPDWLKDFSETP